MSPQEPLRLQRSLFVAIALSLILHGVVLFAPLQTQRPASPPPMRLEASLAPRAAVPLTAVPPSVPSAEAVPAKPQARKRILALDKPQGKTPSSVPPKWSVAQKEEMKSFLDDLGGQARAAPSLAQRSRDMARGLGHEQAREGEEEGVSLERLPDSPPVDPFSLEMYLDGLVKKLNRSAAFVRNDPRAIGLRTALVQIRLNPNGSLKSFRVINAADQQDEIAFVKSVVEQAVPFAPFPADMRRSAGGLAMVICIKPASWSGSFGFTRNPDGRGC